MFFGEIKGLISDNAVDQHGHIWSSTIDTPTLVNREGQTTFLKRKNGVFSSTIEGLGPGAVYYYRAYALYGSQLIYGEVRTLSTDSLLWNGKVDSVKNLIQISNEFNAEGYVTIFGIEQGLFLEDYGIVWGIEPKATIEEDHFLSKGSTTIDGDSLSFNGLITGLQPAFNYLRPYLIIGGLCFYGSEECLVIDDVWTQKEDFPGIYPIRNATVFSIDSVAYIMGGKSVDESLPDNLAFMKSVWAYDTQNNSWSQKKDFDGMGRSNAVGFSINGKGYFGTGNGNEVDYADFWEYDPQIDGWMLKVDSFEGGARFGAVGFSINGKGYIGTGKSAVVSAYDDFWEYDPQTNEWIERNSFDEKNRIHAVGFSINGKGYFGTGKDSLDGDFNCDFYEYDPTNICVDTKSRFWRGSEGSRRWI